MKKRSEFRRCIGLWLAVCFLLIPACAEEAPELLEPVGVQMDTATVYVGDFSRMTACNGVIVAAMEELYFSSGGVIEDVCVIPGQAVRAGDVLATLDQEAQTERLEALRRELEELEVNAGYEDAMAGIDLQLLELDLDQLMMESPRDERAIALKQLEIEEFELNWSMVEKNRQLNCTRIEEEIHLLERQVGDSVLYAPFDGRIVYIADIESTSYVSAYATVMVIADDTRLTIETDIINGTQLNNADEMYALIGANRYAIEPVPVDLNELYTKAAAGEPLKSEFSITNPGEGLEAGMYAAVVIVTNTHESVLLAPINAVFKEENGSYVYVIEEGIRVRRNVETGASNEYVIQITTGLEEGEVVYVPE